MITKEEIIQCGFYPSSYSKDVFTMRGLYGDYIILNSNWNSPIGLPTIKKDNEFLISNRKSLVISKYYLDESAMNTKGESVLFNGIIKNGEQLIMILRALMIIT
tara:strand:- start:630 stop:941 length:312 start_codon:yes stop_codon:yes gene_type:complete